MIMNMKIVKLFQERVQEFWYATFEKDSYGLVTNLYLIIP